MVTLPHVVYDNVFTPPTMDRSVVTWIDEPTGCSYLTTSTGACRSCKKQTHWVSLLFQTWLCQGACVDALWLAYGRTIDVSRG
jgi:hypothetical protein